MITKINTSSEAIADSSGASYIGSSGIYDITINFASVDVADSGAERVNFNVTYNGNIQTIYGPWVQGKNGQPIESGLKLIQKISAIAGLSTGDELTLDTETHNVGKDNKPRDFTVITDFTDLECKMRVQESYSKYNGEIRKAMIPRSFFAANGASAEELIKQANGEDVEIGKRLAYETEKLASNVTYEDDLTPADIEAWYEAKKSGNSSAAKPAPKASVKPAKGGLFS